MARVIKNNLGNFLVIFIIFSLVTTWFFSGWPQIWENPAIPPEIQEALADTERQSPDSYVTQINLDGTIADIDEDPDSPDGNWATTTDSSLDTLAHVSFLTPSGNPTAGPGLQEFKVYVRRSTSLSTPTIYIDLYEGGGFVSNTSLTATNVTNDSGELFIGTWDAVNLSSADGSGVEAYIYGTKNGAAGSSSWVSPTSDVANGWTDSGNAWDDNTVTFAYHSTPSGWGPYLELHHSELQCSKVRGWWGRVNTQVTTIEVDVYYGSAWHNIYSGGIVVGSFQEYEIGSTQSVTAMQVRFFASKANRQAEIYEVDFWEVAPATYSSVDVGAVEWNVDYEVGVPTVSCSTNVGSTDFGTWTDTSIKTSSPNASTTMSCSDTTSGCTLYVKDAGGGGNPGLWKDPDLIPSPWATTTDATTTLSIGVEGYGIQAATTTVGSGAALAIDARYVQTGDVVGALEVTNQSLSVTTSTTTDRETLITHKAAISSGTPSGSYSDTITYECTAT